MMGRWFTKIFIAITLTLAIILLQGCSKENKDSLSRDNIECSMESEVVTLQKNDFVKSIYAVGNSKSLICGAVDEDYFLAYVDPDNGAIDKLDVNFEGRRLVAICIDDNNHNHLFWMDILPQTVNGTEMMLPSYESSYIEEYNEEMKLINKTDISKILVQHQYRPYILKYNSGSYYFELKGTLVVLKQDGSTMEIKCGTEITALDVVNRNEIYVIAYNGETNTYGKIEEDKYKAMGEIGDTIVSLTDMYYLNGKIYAYSKYDGVYELSIDGIAEACTEMADYSSTAIIEGRGFRNDGRLELLISENNNFVIKRYPLAINE